MNSMVASKENTSHGRGALCASVISTDLVLVIIFGKPASHAATAAGVLVTGIVRAPSGAGHHVFS
ncbi:MAG: hypothetical protein ACRDRZ_18810 [Pseudonocardiaceae bacterium]